jgi:hypothetical protein
MGDGAQNAQGGKGFARRRQIARPRKAGIVRNVPPVADGSAFNVKGDHG